MDNKMKLSILQIIEIWLGRSLWLFLLILIVGTKVMTHVTGVSPLSSMSETGDYVLLLALISLGVSLTSILFDSKLRS